MENGPDVHGKWDVEYLIDEIPSFKMLLVLDLSGLELIASEDWDILKVCTDCPSLCELDLSDNSLHELSDVVEDENVTQYTSLCKLDLRSNTMDNHEGRTLGAVLHNCNHLRELCLWGNYWDEDVDDHIRAVWTGPEVNKLYSEKRRKHKKTKQTKVSLIISDNQVFHGLIIKSFDNQTVSLP